MVTRGEKGLKGLQWVTRGYKGLYGFRRDFKGLQGASRGYKGLQGVTGGYKGLLEKITRFILGKETLKLKVIGRII